jgi:beta-glucosidase
MAFSKFPKDFIWGVAASSYQIEGGAFEDGKGLSVWDEFCRVKGAIKYGDAGDIACDHYHRYSEDVNLMSELGYPAYRLSINWPRVLPEGTGRVNMKGLDFYDRLIDALLERNIEPHVTLFHWEYPQALLNMGGWSNPDSPKWFAEYSRVIVDTLSDRVKYWMTLNEPQCFIGSGHCSGMHAPGLKLPTEDIPVMIHNVLLSHGLSVDVIRRNARLKPNIGVSMVGTGFIPESDRAEDIEAARSAIFSFPGKEYGIWSSSVWFDPMFFGRYPDGYFGAYGEKAPKPGPEDMAIISAPIDFLGLNIYWSMNMRQFSMGAFSPDAYSYVKGMPRTNMGWPVVPESLYWVPRFYYERYKLPIHITENGLANQDWVSLDGKVHDPQRIDFMKRYLLEMNRAIADGIDIRAYMHWSILDNFEWAEGYDKRFGLIYVDFQTLKRTPKDSAYWYSNIVKTNGDALFTE